MLRPYDRSIEKRSIEKRSIEKRSIEKRSIEKRWDKMNADFYSCAGSRPRVFVAC